MRICPSLLLCLLSLSGYISVGASPAVDTSLVRTEPYLPLEATILGSTSSQPRTPIRYLGTWTDSIPPQEKAVDTLALKRSIEQSLWKPHSGKAMLWALLPGGGQIYNRKYWKLPIVWGAFMACYYAVSWNHRQYQEYHTAYRDIMSEDPSKNTAWLVFAPSGAKAEDYAQYSSLKQTLKRGNDFYRRYRDLSVVVSVLVYGLSILDAYVDAELYTFDISPDLSLRVVPEVGLPKLGLPAYQLGVNCSLTF